MKNATLLSVFVLMLLFVFPAVSHAQSSEALDFSALEMGQEAAAAQQQAPGQISPETAKSERKALKKSLKKNRKSIRQWLNSQRGRTVGKVGGKKSVASGVARVFGVVLLALGLFLTLIIVLGFLINGWAGLVLALLFGLLALLFVIGGIALLGVD